MFRCVGFPWHSVAAPTIIVQSIERSVMTYMQGADGTACYCVVPGNIQSYLPNTHPSENAIKRHTSLCKHFLVLQTPYPQEIPISSVQGVWIFSELYIVTFSFDTKDLYKMHPSWYYSLLFH